MTLGGQGQRNGRHVNRNRQTTSTTETQENERNGNDNWKCVGCALEPNVKSACFFSDLIISPTIAKPKHHILNLPSCPRSPTRLLKQSPLDLYRSRNWNCLACQESPHHPVEQAPAKLSLSPRVVYLFIFLFCSKPLISAASAGRTIRLSSSGGYLSVETKRVRNFTSSVLQCFSVA